MAHRLSLEETLILLERNHRTIFPPRLPERGPPHQFTVLVTDFDLAVRLFLAVPDDFVLLVADRRHVCRLEDTDAMYELYLRMKIAKGREAAADGHVVPHEDVKCKFAEL